MKLISWCKNNILLLATLFLLFFIPLYPKIPLIGITHTWVYIRLDDFAVAVVIGLWLLQIVRKKVSILTPLTKPIFLFWIIGGIATLLAVIFIFPNIANVFPTLAFFNYIRRIEYISLFFVAFSSIKSKESIKPVVIVLAITLLLVIAYGFAQKYFGFPAFLTMNEEFAKGVPLRLSSLARIPSTFAGHYDLAAYLVMLIAIMSSMVFGSKRIISKIAFSVISVLALLLLLMTASRVSFIVYLLTVSFMCVLQKKKIFIIPIIVGSVLILQLHSFQAISDRLKSTISSADVVVDARTGKVIGIAKEVTKTETTKNGEKKQNVIIEDRQSTGESLPQGSSYINIPQASDQQTVTQIIYKRSELKASTQSATIEHIQGDYIIKKALAYDVSFTTRFQGEWPRAIEAFKRNILLGSGYSSISLGTDGNYLRILGEVGILGLLSFIGIFLVESIYIYRLLPHVTSSYAKSFIIGTTAATFGLALNAILIDVFEASKVAYVLWMLTGISLGLLHLYQTEKVNVFNDIKKVVLSFPAIALYLLIFTFVVFSTILSNYFVGDDFTWIRWAADCKKVILHLGQLPACESVGKTLLSYFTDANGFFYRPGTKLYFFFMNALSSLNPIPYHLFSLFFHYLCGVLLFLLSSKVLKSKIFGFITAVFFLVLSAHTETIMWISAVGHIIAAALLLATLVFYIYGKEKKHWFYFALSLGVGALAPLFHELGIVAPFLILGYELTLNRHTFSHHIKNYWYSLLYFIPLIVYFVLRFLAKNHWFNGDYSYNLFHLPFNIIGNSIGYSLLTYFGNDSLGYYDALRNFSKTHLLITVIIVFVSLPLWYILYKMLVANKKIKQKEIVYFSKALFLIPLLPFLGLGNIAPRYVYLASAGLVLLGVLFLQKLYHRHLIQNNMINIFLVGVICMVVISINFGQIQRINTDWKTAGNITSQTIVDLNDTFLDPQAPVVNPVFYFVNTPIRYESAWIFPVGLNDALWFSFKGTNLAVHQVSTLKLALDAAEGSTSARVLVFKKDGSIESVTKTEKIVPVKKER